MMHFRGVPVRRAFKTKILLLSLVLVTFVFYIKFVSNGDGTNEHDPNTHYANRKLIAGKLVNEYNGDNNVDTDNNLNEQRQRLPADQKHLVRIVPKYNEIYEQMINADIAKQEHGLGNKGRSATLADPVAKEIGEHQLKKIALNEELSEHISYNRTLRDARNPLCRTQHVSVDNLPTTSIIIIFFDEPYSVLVRTVHSVVNTVDYRLLKEIILVDDSSTNTVLKEKLDYYVETRLPPNVVKIIRLKHR